MIEKLPFQDADNALLVSSIGLILFLLGIIISPKIEMAGGLILIFGCVWVIWSTL